MPIFCFNFNFVCNSFSVASFSIYIFLLNNFIFFIFVLCWRLQCQHSCQYFVWTLISFLISFSVTSFSISIFLFNNFILYYFCCCVDDCNADTHANIQYSCTVHWLWLYTWSARALTSVHSLYSINFVHRCHGSDQSEAKKIRHTQWHTQWHTHSRTYWRIIYRYFGLPTQQCDKLVIKPVRYVPTHKDKELK